MARRWTPAEENTYRRELVGLYVTENKSIQEIAGILRIKESTVFDRMRRLQIPTTPHLKPKYRNQRVGVHLPKKSEKLAEFIGIMLGDGHLSHFQALVTLGTKEYPYVRYVQKLMTDLFGTKARVCEKGSGYHDVYIGSTQITDWLREMGLVSHKVREQVDAPDWLFFKKQYLTGFVRGFFDTDGSVYALRFGIQVSFTNRAMPLLRSLRRALVELGYKPSVVSGYAVYLTRREDVERFFNDVRPANTKHQRRYRKMQKDLTRR